MRSRLKRRLKGLGDWVRAMGRWSRTGRWRQGLGVWLLVLLFGFGWGLAVAAAERPRVIEVAHTIN